MPVRYDRAPQTQWRKDARGFLRASANPTRVGVLTYRRADGVQVRELRPLEEVSSPESLATLGSAPVTHLHPTEMVTPDNATTLGVGHVGEDVRMDGGLVQASVVVESADIIQAIERDELSELSCGYACKIDPTPGVWDGQPYDQVQRDIRYNHVALGPKGWGRAGPEVKLRVDSGDAIVDTTPVESNGPPEEDIVNMVKLRLDGQFVEVADESASALDSVLQNRADAAKVELDKLKADKVAAEKSRDEAVARADAAEAERDDALSKIPSADAVQGLVKARTALERDAAKVLGAEVKLDSLTDAEIQVKVLEKARPNFALEGKSADYIGALFTAAVVDAETRADGGLGDLKVASTPNVDRTDAAPVNPFSARHGAFIFDQKAGK